MSAISAALAPPGDRRRYGILAVGAGAALVIVNADPTQYDELAAEVIRVRIGAAAPRIARQLLG